MPGKKRMGEQIAKKKDVAKIAKKVMRAQLEKKALTWRPFSATANAVTWTIKSLLGDTTNGIGQGVNFDDRIGDKIKLSAIHFSIRIIPAGVMPDTNGNFCRVVVWHNKQADGTLPTATELFNSDEVVSLRNHRFKDRLSILRDFTHQMVVTGTNGATQVTSGPEFFGSFSIYPKQIISYTGADGFTADISKHDYGIAFCGDAASCCNVTLWAQPVYTDA